MTDNTKKYHHLLAGQILYKLPGEEIVDIVTLNAMVLTEGKNVTRETLGQGQQSLAMQFHQIMNDPQIELVNICILSWTQLGLMSKTEFEYVKAKAAPATQEGDSPSETVQ